MGRPTTHPIRPTTTATASSLCATATTRTTSSIRSTSKARGQTSHGMDDKTNEQSQYQSTRTTAATPTATGPVHSTRPTTASPIRATTATTTSTICSTTTIG